MWLDHRDIEEKRALVPLTQLSSSFLTSFSETGFYRPLITISESIDAALYGSWPTGYHLTNILWHIAVVAVIPFFVSVFFVLSLPELLILMFVVGVHPLAWLPVGVISYRSEILLTFFTLLTVALHARSRLYDKPLYACGAVVSFLFALFSKETALFLIPAVILLWEGFSRKKKLRMAWELWFAEVLVVIVYGFLRQLAVPDIWRVQQVPLALSEASGTRMLLLMQHLGNFFSPLLPSLNDAVHIVSLTDYLVISFLLCLGILSVVVKKKASREMQTAVLLFAFLLAPALGIIPLPRWGSPHYGYVALIGWGMIILLFIRFFRTTYPRQRFFLYTIVGVWLVVFSLTTLLGGKRFANDETLFLPEVVHTTSFSEGFLYLGNYYAIHNNLSQAEKFYQAALQSTPGVIAYHERTTILVNLSLIQMRQRHYFVADKLLVRAESSSSLQNKAAIIYMRAILATQQKNYPKVIKLLARNAISMHDAKAQLLLANAFRALGRKKEAASVLRVSLPLWDPVERPAIKQFILSL